MRCGTTAPDSSAYQPDAEPPCSLGWARRVVGGQYCGPGGFRELRGHPTVVASSRQSHDAGTQRRLWTISESLTGVTYPL